jgi:prevent-host-death family protein
MKTVSADKVPAHFAEMLEGVRRGEEVTITEDGRPVAILRGIQEVSELKRNRAIDELMEFGKGRTLGGKTIREHIDEGRRF